MQHVYMIVMMHLELKFPSGSAFAIDDETLGHFSQLQNKIALDPSWQLTNARRRTR